MRQEGFTLVELAVVVAIIGILTSVAIPNYNRMREQKYLNVLEANLLDMERNLEAIKASSGGDSYPVSGTGAWIVNAPTNFHYTPCNTLPGDMGMLCSTLPLLPANTPVAATCVGADWSVPSYLYLSDGINYKLMIHCAGTGQAISKSKLMDPNRPVWSISVTNNHAVTDLW